MNVLVDKHHAALFNSLQLLFEDRLGMNVYTPIGHEWWDAGIWRFGQGYGDDRLARQFLDIEPEKELRIYDTNDYLAEQYGLLHDPHYPSRFIRGIYLEDARKLPWDYVVATVQDNQHSFAEWAREVGATFILQVGNVNQDVDWSLDPIALISAEAKVRRRGVYYHQEFDSDGLFAYDEPIGSRRAASFVNCFNSTPCFRWAEEAGSHFPLFLYGIDGRDGNIMDIADVARLMKANDWGWHDKVQGDGFGHVIHYWAALGRPLIGHGSHYRGLMAEPFWEDGVTCIDLDKHPIADVIERVLTIPRDEYMEMSRAIRAKFDELVDWEAEAESIRALLA